MNKTSYISLIDIAKSGTFGPIALGQNISDIGFEILGPPRYWGFAQGPYFLSYMGFGDVEISFESKNDAVVVRYAELRVRRVRGGIARFTRSSDGNKLQISGLSRREVTYESMKALMEQHSVNYSTIFDKKLTIDTSEVMDFQNGVQFYFGLGADKALELVAMSEP
ncbi:hypothetical protein [Labrys wisconsinensis]|uniref:Uncharacterized protein n=1 Tax=Labrys wisconsinensis TaxID=425677 RepID=A0ABU0JJ22_9HYPH|nr:hypothetical protein [Labrys wisconsinensis]MDQ0473264.1 hypothetical protein [Labrys wisconsinensis]